MIVSVVWCQWKMCFFCYLFDIQKFQRFINSFLKHTKALLDHITFWISLCSFIICIIPTASLSFFICSFCFCFYFFFCLIHGGPESHNHQIYKIRMGPTVLRNFVILKWTLLGSNPIEIHWRCTVSLSIHDLCCK